MGTHGSRAVKGNGTPKIVSYPLPLPSGRGTATRRVPIRREASSGPRRRVRLATPQRLPLSAQLAGRRTKKPQPKLTERKAMKSRVLTILIDVRNNTCFVIRFGVISWGSKLGLSNETRRSLPSRQHARPDHGQSGARVARDRRSYGLRCHQ